MYLLLVASLQGHSRALQVPAQSVSYFHDFLQRRLVRLLRRNDLGLGVLDLLDSGVANVLEQLDHPLHGLHVKSARKDPRTWLTLTRKRRSGSPDPFRGRASPRKSACGSRRGPCFGLVLRTLQQ